MTGKGALVILPTYNERDNVARLVSAVLELAPGARVLVVDDASPDGTALIVTRMMRRDPRVALLQREGKLGLGTAYLAGFRAALDGGYRYAITMDADLSHDPRHLGALLRAVGEGDADLVVGSRYVPGGRIVGWGAHRRLLSGCANFFAHTALRLQAHDCTSGYRCYARSTLEALDLDAVFSNGYSALIELLWRCERMGCRVGEVPITFVDRRAGASKVTPSEISRAVCTILRLATHPPAVRAKDRSGDATPAMRDPAAPDLAG